MLFNFFNLFLFFVSVTVSLCKQNLINTFVLNFLILSVKSLKHDTGVPSESAQKQTSFVRQNWSISVLTQLVKHQNPQLNVETKNKGYL